MIFRRLVMQRSSCPSLCSLVFCYLVLSSSAVALASDQPASAIADTDVVALLDPRAPNSSQSWSGLNCFGQYPSLSKVPDSGIAGPSGAGQDPIRFGRAEDPLQPGRIAFVFNVRADDPLTAGAKRCEALAPPAARTAIPRGQPFWYAFRMLLWRGADAESGQALLTQWHVHGFNPFFGLIIKNGHLSFTARYSQQPGTRKSDRTTLELWRDNAPAQRRWMTFVVHAHVSPNVDERPFIRIWRDGQLLVDYTGPLGYQDMGVAYAKIGYYHWLDNNTWDAGSPERTVFISKAILVRDEAAHYKESQLRQVTNE